MRRKLNFKNIERFINIHNSTHKNVQNDVISGLRGSPHPGAKNSRESSPKTNDVILCASCFFVWPVCIVTFVIQTSVNQFSDLVSRNHERLLVSRVETISRL